MTIVDLGTSKGNRYRTTVCSLCGAKRGEDYTRYYNHLAEHSFEDLNLRTDDAACSPRQEVGACAD